MHTIQAQQHRHTKSRRGVTRSMAVLNVVYQCKMLTIVMSHLDYYKEKKRVQRSKESLEGKEIRLRQIREYARMRRSIENESPAHREACVNDERLRSQQRLDNESEPQREVRLEDLRQRSQQ